MVMIATSTMPSSTSVLRIIQELNSVPMLGKREAERPFGLEDGAGTEQGGEETGTLAF